MALAAVGARRPPVAQDQGPIVPLRDQLRGSRVVLQFSISLCSSPATALFVPFVFMADYIAERGLDRSGGLIVGLIGLSSVIGRMGLGALATRVEAMALFYLSLATMAFSYLIWFTAGDRYWQLLVFALVLGVAYGGFIALSPVVAAQLFGTVGLGGVLGALYTAAGIRRIDRPLPTAGALIDRIGYRRRCCSPPQSPSLGAATYFLLSSGSG